VSQWKREETIGPYRESVLGNVGCLGDDSNRESLADHDQVEVVEVGGMISDTNNVVAEAS
jgi:hypothetical protein